MESKTLNPLSPPPVPRGRTNFLTVLCVLTFVVSGYYFFKGVGGLIVGSQFSSSDWAGVSEGLEELMANADEKPVAFMQKLLDAAGETVNAAMEHVVALGVTGLVVSLLSVLGAIMMWRLRKNGFYLYLIAKLIGVIVPIMLIGVNILTASYYGFALFISIVMFILYGMNLRYMR